MFVKSYKMSTSFNNWYFISEILMTYECLKEKKIFFEVGNSKKNFRQMFLNSYLSTLQTQHLSNLIIVTTDFDELQYLIEHTINTVCSSCTNKEAIAFFFSNIVKRLSR